MEMEVEGARRDFVVSVTIHVRVYFWILPQRGQAPSSKILGGGANTHPRGGNLILKGQKS